MTTERDTQHLMDKYGVAWYKFDEESGNQIIDSLGNYDGTAYNVTRVAGVSGNALSFNGSSSYVQFASKILGSHELAIKFSIKTSTNSAGFIISNAAGRDNAGGYLISLTSRNIRFAMTKSSSDSYGFDLLSNKNVSDGEWHDVLCVFTNTTDENGVKIFIDDMKTPDAQGKASYIYDGSSSGTNSHNLTLGRRNVFHDAYFNGQLDEIEIYDKALTYEDLFPNKTLIRSDDNIHYTYDNGIWQPIGENPTQQDYEQYGMYDGDLQALTKADLLTLPNLTSGKPKVRTFKYS